MFLAHKNNINCTALAKGFSLIEALIVVVIIGITTTVAIPAYNQWIADAQTRTVAEVLQNSIRLAQAEAVKSGRQVQFFLTENTPAASVATSSTGRNWGIQTMQLIDSAQVDSFFQGSSIAGISNNVAVNASSATIQFNSIGRVTAPIADISITLTNATSPRTLRVTVSLSGAIRMCDASKSRGTSADGC